MSRERLLFATYLLMFFQTCRAEGNSDFPASSCGNIPNISYPFRLENDPPHCGDSYYTLSCENNLTVLYLSDGKYLVQAINYHNSTIRLVDSSIQKDNCSSLPRFPLTTDDFNFLSPYIASRSDIQLSQNIIFTTCALPAGNSSLYVDTAPCIGGAPPSNSSLPHLKTHSYVIVGRMAVSELMESCSVDMMTLLPKGDYGHMSYVEIHRELTYGFQLSWHNAFCGSCGPFCYTAGDTGAYCGHYESIAMSVLRMMYKLAPLPVLFLVGYHTVLTLFGMPCVIAFLIYKWRRRHLSAYNTIEEFLQNHYDLMPVRYSYSEIKKMAAGFKNKLGEGGYGCVYKGKLRSGRLAVIKMLGKPEGDGQDFINEVATIGRIHHTNIVQLIGFCVEGSKRALVYDFMPTGLLIITSFLEKDLHL